MAINPNSTTDPGPTYWEGWNAHAMGWGLPDGHTTAYIKGWKDRAALIARYERDRRHV